MPLPNLRPPACLLGAVLLQGQSACSLTAPQPGSEALPLPSLHKGAHKVKSQDKVPGQSPVPEIGLWT